MIYSLIIITSQMTRFGASSSNCRCDQNFYFETNYGGISVSCLGCNTGQIQSLDGYRCVNPLEPDCPGIKLDIDESGLPLDSFRCLECNSTTSRPGENSCQSCRPFIFAENDNQDITCDNFESGGFVFFENSNIPNNLNSNFPNPTESWLFKEFSLAAYRMCQIAERRNVTACQFLANMWTLNLYSQDALMNDPDNKLVNLFSMENQTAPWLIYPIGLNEYKNQYSSNGIDSQFLTLKLTGKCANSQLELITVEHDLWGGFKRAGPFDITNLQLCNFNQRLNQPNSAPFTITNLFTKCTVSIQRLFEFSDSTETIFYDLYLKFGNGSQVLPLPVNIKQVNQPSNSIYRRFFLFETASSKKSQESKSDYIRFAKSVKLIINHLNRDQAQIYPPIIEIEYDFAKRDEQRMVDLSFEIKYLMDTQSYQQTFFIVFGILAGLAFLWSIIRTWNWNQRAARIILDLVSIFKFFMFLIGSIPNCIILVLSGLSIFWFIIFKSQTSAALFAPQPDQEKIFATFLIIAFVLKLLDLLYLTLLQTSYDIFFIDWEKARYDDKSEKNVLPPINSLNDNFVLKQQVEKQNSISCWRTILIANKWNTFQTMRKTSTAIQMILVIFFLKVLGFESYARTDCEFKKGDNSEYAPYSFILRVGIGSIIFIGVELLQILFYTLFYSRCIQDEIGNFADFCSVSNISVLLLTHSRFGYYIHGRSPTGISDTSFFNLKQGLSKEESDLTFKRGLEMSSDHQIFSAIFPIKLVKEYSKIMTPIIMNSSRFDSKDTFSINKFDNKMLAYTQLNNFFKDFLNNVRLKFIFVYCEF
ncbi:meckelin isoform X2 [Brachionus plicatilis]|uniref:Meckelin isoform X2 n=1 Tax=Brachionus plicatilis TaxID=10195 RepID=A0A3M7RZI8_BRAPC|nr:meckelin isoform X2 [Brachionus plicatilis]